MHLKATATAQNINNASNVHYKPTDADEPDLFDEQKNVMCSVFELTLLTDQGKSTVRAHESDYEAQKVYEDLLNYHTISEKASLTTSSRLIYLTIARIDEWKGTDESSMLY